MALVRGRDSETESPIALRHAGWVPAESRPRSSYPLEHAPLRHAALADPRAVESARALAVVGIAVAHVLADVRVLARLLAVGVRVRVAPWRHGLVVRLARLRVPPAPRRVLAVLRVQLVVADVHL